MKMVIDDPWMGEREIGPGAAIIRDQLKLLKQWRDDGRKPSAHLLQDIEVYEFILNSQDPDILAEKYMEEMHRLRNIHGFAVKKIDVARNLGWFK